MKPALLVPALIMTLLSAATARSEEAKATVARPDAPAAPPRRPLQVAIDPDDHGTSSPPSPPPPVPPPSDGAGPRLTFGRTITEDIADGWYGRFESEYFESSDIRIGGALVGLEGWGSSDGGGGALPISVFWGLRVPLGSRPKAPRFFASLGFGFDCLLIDVVQKDVGFGVFAPFGTGVIGLEIFPGARILADGRAQYRWQWAAEDRYQIRAGVSLAVNSNWWDGP